MKKRITEDPRALPADVKQEIREMAREGLTPLNIARYLGLNAHRVRRIIFPKERLKHIQSVKNWMKKNPKKVKVMMKKAGMKWLSKPGNKERAAKWRRAYYVKNREKVLEINRVYYQKNRKKVDATARRYRMKNREKMNAKAVARYHAKKKLIKKYEKK